MSDVHDWVGRERVQEDLLAPFPARAMAALLDRDPTPLRTGARLPAGWHWLYFHDAVRRSELGPDGHERLGGFLPPVPLPRRMWAGGRLAFPGELLLGESAVRRSTIARVEEKEGRSGPLVFVTVRHRIETGRGVAVDEEQDLVYRAPPPSTTGSGAPGPAAAPPPAGPFAWSEDARADEVTLFRFSALTFNGHRIHYDRPWATEREGYPGLVVHGPLLALLLLDAATRRSGAGRPPARFDYRALGPLFVDEPFRLEGDGAPVDPEARAEVRVAGPRGVAMRASAGWRRDATADGEERRR